MPDVRLEFGLGIKSNRLLFGLLCTLFLTELFLILTNIVANLGFGVWALLRIHKTYLEFPGVSVLLSRVILDIGSYMISLWNLGVIASTVIVYSIHGSHATVKKNVPVKRYQDLSQFWSVKGIVSVLMMGVACAVFAQCILVILGLSLSIVYDCNKKNENPPHASMVCVNEINIFVMFFIMILAIGAYFCKRISTKGYQLFFYQMPKSFLEHMFAYFGKHRIHPMKIYLVNLPVILLVYKVLLQTPIWYTIYFLREVVFLESKMEKWTDALDLELIAKSLIGSYVGLTVFRFQWFCVNYFLVKKPNEKIDLLVEDANTVVNLNYLSSSDTYVQALGWYDLSIQTQNSSPLSHLFTLSHPGNKPHIWRRTLDQSLHVGNSTLENFKGFISKHMDRFIAATKTAQTKTTKFRGAGLTMYYSDQASSNGAIDGNLRRRETIGRDLSSNTAPVIPAVIQQQQLNFWGTMFLCPIIVVKSMMDFFKTRVFNVTEKVKQREWWIYWMEPAFELEFSNLLANYFLMHWSMNVIVTAICVAVENNSTNMIMQDIERLNKFFVDTCETVGKLGRLVPMKVTKTKFNGDLVEIDSEVKAEYKKLKNVIMFQMRKYYELVSPNFDNISIKQNVLEQLQKCMKNSECWGEDVNLHLYER